MVKVHLLVLLHLLHPQVAVVVMEPALEPVVDQVEVVVPLIMEMIHLLIILVDQEHQDKGLMVEVEHQGRLTFQRLEVVEVLVVQGGMQVLVV
jgi:hypothetical protein